MAGHNWVGILQPKDASKPAQPGGCGMCHPGLGGFPNLSEKISEADEANIDCLLCHAPNYRRTVAKVGDKLKIVPAPGIDVLKAAQSVQKPTEEMCLRCHGFAGGGPNHKHGVTPTKDSDVHSAMGFACVKCHITKEHKVAGGADLKAQELIDVKVDCSNCHTETPHRGSQAVYLNDHARLACQTCHIPAIARDPKMPTVVKRDWTKPVLNTNIGLYFPTNQMVSNMKPLYRWWNRLMKIVPEPVGSIDDPKSKIMVWKKTDYVNIADAQTGHAVYIKAGVYSVTGDVGAAAKIGAADAKQSYSGQWKPIEETLYFSLNHQVAPRTQALKCNDCHSPNGVMNFVELGYSKPQLSKLIKSY